jgi:hypothetical protein
MTKAKVYQLGSYHHLRLKQYHQLSGPQIEFSQINFPEAQKPIMSFAIYPANIF